MEALTAVAWVTNVCSWIALPLAAYAVWQTIQSNRRINQFSERESDRVDNLIAELANANRNYQSMTQNLIEKLGGK